MLNKSFQKMIETDQESKEKLRGVYTIITLAAIFSALLFIYGVYWDISYHKVIGRDTIWIPPHLMIYTGILIILFATLLGLWNARKIHSPFSKKIFFALWLILGSIILQMSSAPFDAWWHEAHDNAAVWDPPHLVLIFGTFFIALSVISFQKLYIYITRLDNIWKLTWDKIKIEIMFALALVQLNILLAEFEFFMRLPGPEWLYLALLTIQFSFIFTLAKILTGDKWAIARIATIYFFIRLSISVILFSSGFSLLIFPPMVIIPAILFSILTYRRTDFKNIMFAVLIFSLTFYITETAFLYGVGINRYIPSIFELIGGSIISVVFSIIAYSLGKKILKQRVIS